MHELVHLLRYCGFELEVGFSADVHHNHAGDFFPVDRVAPLLEFRAPDLGQYLFVRVRNERPPGQKRPQWLYRSYPPGELE